MLLPRVPDAPVQDSSRAQPSRINSLRLSPAISPFRVTVQSPIQKSNWRRSAFKSSNLNERCVGDVILVEIGASAPSHAAPQRRTGVTVPAAGGGEFGSSSPASRVRSRRLVVRCGAAERAQRSRGRCDLKSDGEHDVLNRTSCAGRRPRDRERRTAPAARKFISFLSFDRMQRGLPQSVRARPHRQSGAEIFRQEANGGQFRELRTGRRQSTGL